MSAPPKMAGDLLESRYRIRSPLRCEGAGRLDCAEDEQTGTRMAIRWLPLDANGVSAARSLQQMPLHPTLPKIRSTGTLGRSAYVAMDFPEGRLLSALTPDQLPLDVLCKIGAELADALATLHAQNVFHGELATDSVLLLEANAAVMWDMPIVLLDRLTDRRGGERGLSVLRRKAAFLAPECARGQPCSAATDVYALGALMCLSAGARAPSGPTTLSLIHQIAGGQWRPDPPAVYGTAHRALLQRMTHRDPFSRPGAADVARLFKHADPTHPYMQPLSDAELSALSPSALEASAPGRSGGRPALQQTEQVDPEKLQARIASAQAEAKKSAPEAHVLARSRRMMAAKVAFVSIPVAAVAAVGLYLALSPSQPSFEAIEAEDVPDVVVRPPRNRAPPAPEPAPSAPTPAAEPPAKAPEPARVAAEPPAAPTRAEARPAPEPEASKPVLAKRIEVEPKADPKPVKKKRPRPEVAKSAEPSPAAAAAAPAPAPAASPEPAPAPKAAPAAELKRPSFD